MEVKTDKYTYILDMYKPLKQQYICIYIVEMSKKVESKMSLGEDK